MDGKIFRVFLLLFVFIGCAGLKQIYSCGHAGTYTVMDGLACTNFKEYETPALNSLFAVENSYVYYNGDLISLYDLNATGEMSKGTVGADLKGLSNTSQVIASGARFSYVIDHGGIFKNFVTRYSDVYLLTSANLTSWTEVGKVLENTLYPYQWNAAVAYDSTGKAHMLVEAGNQVDQTDVRCAYLTAASGTNNFQSAGLPDIANCGNPWVANIDGKGLLAVHGSVNGENGNKWRIRASILPDGDSQWKEAPLTTFDVAESGVHVADPHLIETTDGRILMSMSHDQGSTISFISRHPLTFENLYDQIREAIP